MPITIGVVFGSFEEVAKDVLSYLLVYQNTIQKTFEFRILSCSPSDSFLALLNADRAPSHVEIEQQVGDFLSRVKSWNDSQAEAFGLDPVRVDKVALLTNTAFSDYYYYVGEETWAVIALGGWENEYAPPSIVEYYLSFVVLAAIDVRTNIGRHFETRGCIFDFNASLADARLSVLSGHICESCAHSITTETSSRVLNDTRLLLARPWLGDSSNPSDVAVTVKKLGYDLFRTSGIKPTWKEWVVTTLEQEGLKNLLNITFQILLVAALVLLGFKQK